jgi:penicillin-binding protein 1A
MRERKNEVLADAGYYAEEVRRFVAAKYGDEAMYNGGLFIRTSLDPVLQKAASEALRSGLLTYDRRHGWRGPIGHFETTAEGKIFLEQNKVPVYVPGDWQYAVVIAVSDEAADLILLHDEPGRIELKDLAWAKKALPDGRVGNPVKSVGDVLSVGDLIYVSPKKESGLYVLRQMPAVEGALVALDPHTGRVLAMTGGFSFQKNQFNRAVQALRQPGSSFKPFVYLAALDSGYTPSSLILDAPLVMEQPDGTKWKPRNYSRVFYGPITLRVGIEKSRNLMTIRLAQAIGMRKILNYGKKFGISERLEPVLATALGSGETTLMRLTTAYGMLVNGGKQIEPSLIDRIQNRDGKTIYRHDERICHSCTGGDASPDVKPEIPDEREQIQDPASAYQMVNILTGVIERGTGKSVKSLKKTLGAKSGTSNDSIDAWFIGFSPDLVVGVWVGFDEPKTLGPNDTGGVTAAPIFKNFMKVALKDKPNIPFRVPPTVELVRVNPTTGKPAEAGDTDVIMEAFRHGTDIHKPTKIIGKDITIKEDDNLPDMGGLY